MTEPKTEGADRYLHDWTKLRDGSPVEIDPQNAESLTAFQDACAEQKRILGGDV